VSDDAALRHVADLEQLRALGQRYARAVDGGDYDALCDLFHRDAVIEGVRGVAARDEYVDTMRASPRAYEQSMHMLADPLISLAPGADTATLDTYAVVHQIGAVRTDGERGSNATLGMRYVDEVVRDGDSWRIRHRRATMLWMA
jgi:3-phenylpropionate/cinnamic acid dioxygenase small subunit